jgi:hypothetical protein
MHHLLLIAGVIMASCPVISTSRGGALITFGLMAVGAFGWVASLLLWGPTRWTRSPNDLAPMTLPQ